MLALIAAANLANLQLVDDESHRREAGIRRASGAGLIGGVVLAAWLHQAPAASQTAAQTCAPGHPLIDRDRPGGKPNKLHSHTIRIPRCELAPLAEA